MRALIYSSLSAAILMAMSGTAYANGNWYPPQQEESGATLIKKVKAEVDVEYKGDVRIDGQINVRQLGMAVVNNEQASSGNMTANFRTENDSHINGSFNNSSGNIGANVAAGDANVQGNSVALAAYDASFLTGGASERGSNGYYMGGGSADAEVFSSQVAGGNLTTNMGHQNTAGVGNGSFANASGNIGVNVTSGSGNVQANNMAATVASKANMAVATVDNGQATSGNATSNTSLLATKTVSYAPVKLALYAHGTYEGDGHTTKPHHSSDNDRGGIPTPSFGFEESGTLDLKGAVVGFMPIVNHYTSRDNFNKASISGGAFKNASGNIGVNVASGTNNLQANNLALAAGQ